ncbi:unnamed protein product [Brassicogethes aeneus]|uniref:BRISC and BRCA1-A complex member 2 n=1 Tax=Brassicogethes aeneus TaxID=1431903 RepID=A0A9P0B3A0_BRAAE|nr:unnamed protein product [Brassicogethes aeneus]
MDLSNNDEDLLLNYPPCLRSNIKELCLRGKIGLSNVTANDLEIVHNKIANKVIHSYHFIIKVPYAGKRLSWEIIFNPEDYSFAPDFDFKDDTFLANPDVKTIIENVPSLNEWDINNPEAIVDVLKEFLSLFKKEQLEKINVDNMYTKVKEEYEELINKCEISPDNIEVIAENNIVHLLIALNIDYDKIPPYIQLDPSKLLNPGEDFIHLRMSYTANRTTPALLISARVEQTLGQSKSFHIPEVAKDSTISEYLDNINNVLSHRIKLRVKDYEKRKMFMCYILAMSPEHVVDYDIGNLMNCMVKCTLEGNDFLVEISVDQHFPQKKPALWLIHDCEKEECKDPIRNLQWNANLSVKEMFETVLTCLNDELPKVRPKHKL